LVYAGNVTMLGWNNVAMWKVQGTNDVLYTRFISEYTFEVAPVARHHSSSSQMYLSFSPHADSHQFKLPSTCLASNIPECVS